ncbi:MAG: CotH kinase family protein [Abditibacteriota bacterium]|nr:CotH kinase family protein [Abditibacteriota bacterium]
MKKILPIAFCVIIAAVAVFYMVSEMRKQPLGDFFTVAVTAPGGEKEYLVPWSDDGKTYVVFLPGFADPARSEIAKDTTHPVLIDGKDADGPFPAELGKTYSVKCGLRRAELRFMKCSPVASIFIETQSGTEKHIHSEDPKKEKARFTVFDSGGKLNYAGGGKDKIKPHGHSTLTAEKKSYNFDMKRPASVLGMPAADRYVLLSNAFDQTNMRNKIVYDYAAKVMPDWTPRCEYVDLYLNGVYNGLYLLSERVEVAPDRVTGVDCMINVAMGDSLEGAEDAFLTSRSRLIKIRYPKGPDEAQTAEVKSFVDKAEKALLAGDMSYFDLDSAARRFLVDEIFLNADMDSASSYYRGVGGKLFAGPVWDYDISMGNCPFPDSMFAHYPRQLFGTRLCYDAETIRYPHIRNRKLWYSNFYKNEDFRNKVKSLYAEEFLPLLKDFMEKRIPEIESSIALSNACDDIRHRSSARVFIDAKLAKRRSTAEEIDAMKTFLKLREDFLTNVWVKGKEYRSVWFSDITTPFYKTGAVSECISDQCPVEIGGKHILAVPTPPKGSKGWYLYGTDKLYTHGELTEDVILTSEPTKQETP